MESNVYTDEPRYIEGHSIVLAFLLLAIANAVALIVWIKRVISQKDQILADYAARGDAHPHISRSLEDEFDGHVNFRYIISKTITVIGKCLLSNFQFTYAFILNNLILFILLA
jgi:hypothetical protein